MGRRGAVLARPEYLVLVACVDCGVGEWFAAEAAAPALGRFHHVDAHQELRVIDHQGSPVPGEYGPDEARQWAEWLATGDPDLAPTVTTTGSTGIRS